MDILEILGNQSINELWFHRNTDDLEIYVLGEETRVSIENWYLSDLEKVDVIKNGIQYLEKYAVDALVNSMAAFGAPSGGSIQLTAYEQEQVSNAIANAWQ